MKYDESTLVEHEVRLNNLIEVIRGLKSEINKISQRIDENEAEYINFSDTYIEEFDEMKERVKKYDVEATLVAHEAQLNDLTEVIRELKNEVKKMTQYVDESERECSNYTDTLEEELDTTRERVKKQSALIDLLVESNQKLKDEIYILKQKTISNERDISYLAEIIDNIE